MLFNDAIPQDLGFVDRSNPDNALILEINFLVNKKQLGNIIDRCIKKHGTTKTAIVLDNIKSLGFKYSTRGAITVGFADIIVPDIKKKLIEDTDKKVDYIVRQYRRGLITEDERYENQVFYSSSIEFDFSKD
jgi:DNA-directed RNA polymerase subunit beta'